MSELKALLRRVRLMIGRGVLTLVNDASKMQEIQASMLAGEVLDKVEHWQPYGFTYHPHKGGEPLLVFPKGDRSHGVCIAVADRRYRLKNLAEGEIALYDDLDQVVHLKRDGIEVASPVKVSVVSPLVDITASTKVRVDSPLFEVTGEIIDRVDGDGVSLEDMRNTYDLHDHPGDSGGTTGPPNQGMG